LVGSENYSGKKIPWTQVLTSSILVLGTNNEMFDFGEEE
jgi:hypothetical protein